MSTLYGFRFDRDAEGVFYVKQRAEDGEMIAIPDVAQDRRRFATWQEARDAGEEWAERANGRAVDGMTYRERRERRTERLRGWADGRETKAARSFDTAHTLADGIPLGQPILVGHHSEKRHRRTIDRIDQAMRAGVEHSRKVESMRERADNIERAADHAIYSDDPDAVERLAERIAELEAERDRIKAYNASARKAAKTGGMGDTSLLTESERRELLDLARVAAYQLRPGGGFPAYRTGNLGGNIARLRERLTMIEKRAERSARAADAGGIVVDRRGEYARVTFADKPSADTRDELKAAGYWYSGGSWQGRADALPERYR